MNRNGRRIALSMVAIVLGAGYLMKVIPPETDVGVNDSHSISIDGSLVTNPLDIGEVPHSYPPSALALYPNPSAGNSKTDSPSSGGEEPSSFPEDLEPTPTFPFVSGGGSNFQPSQPAESVQPETDLPSGLDTPPTLPNIGEVAVNTAAPGNGSSLNPPGGNSSPGSPPVQNPGNQPDEEEVELEPVPPIDPNGPDSPPIIDLPTDPLNPGPKIPEIVDSLPDFPTDNPIPRNPSTGSDNPTHEVPDSEPMIILLGLSLTFLAAVKRHLVN